MWCFRNPGFTLAVPSVNCYNYCSELSLILTDAYFMLFSIAPLQTLAFNSTYQVTLWHAREKIYKELYLATLEKSSLETYSFLLSNNLSTSMSC